MTWRQSSEWQQQLSFQPSALLVVALAGVLVGLVAVLWAVRSKRGVDAELARVATRARRIDHTLDRFPDGVLEVDHLGIVLSANRAAEALFGIHRDGDATPRGSNIDRVFDYEVDDPTGAMIVASRSPLIGKSLIALIDPGGTHREARTRLSTWLSTTVSATGHETDTRSAGVVSPTDPLRDPSRGLVVSNGSVPGRDVRLEAMAASGAPIMLLARDATAEVHRDRDLEVSAQRQQRIVSAAPIGMAIARIHDGRILEANEPLAAMLGMPAELLVGCTLREFTHPDDISLVQQYRAQLEIGAIDEFGVEHRLRRRDGEQVWVRTRFAMLERTDQPTSVAYIEEIGELKTLREKVHGSARQDETTGLLTRAWFGQLLVDRLHEHPHERVSVLIVDIDRFGAINDANGTVAADAVLRAVVERITAVAPSDASIARVGSDEIAILTSAEPDRIATRIHQALVDPVELEQQSMQVTVSIGIASTVDADGDTATGIDPVVVADDLLRDARAALRRAQRDGGQTTRAFASAEHDGGLGTTGALGDGGQRPSSDGLGAGLPGVVRTSGEVGRGINRGEFVPYYQPIVDLRSGVLIGHEALVRWLHPDHGLLQPNRFLRQVEDAGLLEELELRVLRDALSQAGQWDRDRRFAQEGLIMTVNVVGSQLTNPAFVSGVADALTQTTFDPSRLWLDITEGSLGGQSTDAQGGVGSHDAHHDASHGLATASTTELRHLGLHLVIDNFGTGESSVTLLSELPVEAIKIDRGLIGGLGIDQSASALVKGITRLAQSLGLSVVAEGVESPLQLQLLRDLDVDLAQGYLFGRPRPASLIDTADELSAAD